MASPIKFLFKLLFQITGLVVVMMTVVVGAAHLRGKLPPEVQKPLIDMILLPFTFDLICKLLIFL